MNKYEALTEALKRAAAAARDPGIQRRRSRL